MQDRITIGDKSYAVAGMTGRRYAQLKAAGSAATTQTVRVPGRENRQIEVVDPNQVPTKTRELARRVLAGVCAEDVLDLGMPSIVWWTPKAADHGEEQGYFNPALPDQIMVKADITAPYDLAVVLLHEVRHKWQYARWGAPDHTLNWDAYEKDAREFADQFVRRLGLEED